MFLYSDITNYCLNYVGNETLVKFLHFTRVHFSDKEIVI